MLGQNTLISFHREANGYIFFATGVNSLKSLSNLDFLFFSRICYDDDVKVIALPYPTLSHDIVCISSLFCDVFGLFNDPFALSI